MALHSQIHYTRAAPTNQREKKRKATAVTTIINSHAIPAKQQVQSKPVFSPEPANQPQSTQSPHGHRQTITTKLTTLPQAQPVPTIKHHHSRPITKPAD